MSGFGSMTIDLFYMMHSLDKLKKTKEKEEKIEWEDGERAF